MADEIKDIVEKAIEEHESDFLVKLTKKQVITALAAVTTVAGVIFGAGMKTQSGIDNIKISQINVQHQQDIAKYENEKIILNKEKLIALEDVDFFKNRYLMSQKRLDTCLKKGDFIEFMSSSDENK